MAQLSEDELYIKGVRRFLTNGHQLAPAAVLAAHLREVEKTEWDQAMIPRWVPKLFRWLVVIAALSLFLTLDQWTRVLPSVPLQQLIIGGLVLTIAAGLARYFYERAVDQRRARVVQGMLEAEDGRPRNCIRCGYDLTHLDHDRCPECGTVSNVTPPGKLATDSLRPASRWRNLHRHPRLRRLHPTVARNIVYYLRNEHRPTVDGIAKVTMIGLGVLAIAIGLMIGNHFDGDTTMAWAIGAAIVVGVVPFLVQIPLFHSRIRRSLGEAHLPCWFCGSRMTASICTACKARNVTRDEVDARK